MNNKIRKQYELECKDRVDISINFYRIMFGGGAVIKYLKKCIKLEEKLLKKLDNFWSEGDIKNLIKQK